MRTPGERQHFFTQVRRGVFVAVVRGVYVPSERWSQMDTDERYLMRVRATAMWAASELVFSHHSAVALWRLPWIGGWPSRVHVTSALARGGRSNATLSRHTVGVPTLLEHIDGLTVTTLARTVVDIARTSGFAKAVAVADAALRRTAHPLTGLPRSWLTHDDLLTELDVAASRQGTAKIRAVIDFADPNADRPGESLSRVNMYTMHLPAPQIQERITGASGKVWLVDFFWPACKLVGEFDGKAKYTDPVFLRGRTPEIALLDEKAREDDIRAAGYRLSRWGWDVARSPIRLRDHLVAAGLR